MSAPRVRPAERDAAMLNASRLCRRRHISHPLARAERRFTLTGRSENRAMRFIERTPAPFQRATGARHGSETLKAFFRRIDGRLTPGRVSGNDSPP